MAQPNMNLTIIDLTMINDSPPVVISIDVETIDLTKNFCVISDHVDVIDLLDSHDDHEAEMDLESEMDFEEEINVAHEEDEMDVNQTQFLDSFELALGEEREDSPFDESEFQ